jgi:hypothetical protein
MNPIFLPDKKEDTLNVLSDNSNSLDNILIKFINKHKYSKKVSFFFENQ